MRSRGIDSEIIETLQSLFRSDPILVEVLLDHASDGHLPDFVMGLLTVHIRYLVQTNMHYR
uniref:Uncharacterized protein n=1 Tax=Amphimedon queenslandica TaxID=400682 RepID=A0A1X7UP41_AMPQE